jgi:hypothetical protein
MTQVDYDRMQLGKFAVDEALWGDIAITAALLRDGLGFGGLASGSGSNTRAISPLLSEKR